MHKIDVVNIMHFGKSLSKIRAKFPGAYVAYCGRDMQGYKLLDRGLGNPSRKDREIAIQEFEAELDKTLREPKTNPVLWGAFLMLIGVARKQDIVLVCWCKPERCHADVIKDRLEKIVGELEPLEEDSSSINPQ